MLKEYNSSFKDDIETFFDEVNHRLFLRLRRSSFSLTDLGKEMLKSLLKKDYDVLVVVLKDNYYLYYSKRDVERALDMLKE